MIAAPDAGSARRPTGISTHRGGFDQTQVMTDSWPCRHFSQANPVGPGQDDVPALLRRVADSITDLGPVEVHDLVLHTQITEDGPWHNLTVYFTNETAT